MNQIFKFIFITILLTTINSECSPGCIKCNASKTCSLCDIDLSMILQEGKCVEQPNPNCLYYGLNSECLTCQKGYFMDTATNKCTKIETNIDNCVYYQTEGQCSICEKDYYTSGGKCINIVDEIENCKHLENGSLCMQCEDGYVLTSNKQQCIQLNTKDEIRNCHSYSNMICKTCQDNFIINKNYYIKITFEDFDITQFENFNTHQNFPKLSPSVDVCQPIIVQDCAEYKDANTCIRCQNGFFIENGKCIKNPFAKIPNCFIYENHNKCLQCLPNFYLENDTSCKAIAETSIVENCLINTASECTKCNEGFYLKSNQCLPNPTIENCSTYKTNDALCQSCSFGFILTGDFKKCLPEIPNCVSYEPTTEADTNLLCTGCTNGTYLTTDKQCTQGSVDNCNEYSGSATSCTQCKNQFYKDGQECKPHDVQPFCTLYSNTIKNKCTQCETNHFLFTIDTGCYKADDITNCLDYSSKTDCEKCVLGFYLEDNQCKQIPAEENCLERNTDATKCNICKLGYYLNSKKKCELIYKFQESSCSKKEGELDGYYKCDTCNPLYFYLELENDSAICILNDRITSDIKINNCQSYLYDLSEDKYKCKNCGSNFITETSSSDMLACQEQCTDSDQTIIETRYTVTQSDQNDTNYHRKKINFDKYRGKTCTKESSDTNCLQTVIDNKGIKACAIVKNNSTLLPQLRKDPGQESSLGYENDFQNITKHGYTISTFSFHTNDQATVTPVYQDSGNKCESYFKGDQVPLETTFNYYCDSCQFGKTGTIKQNLTYNYIDCDVDIAGCSTKQYGGLQYDFQSYRIHNVNTLLFRCHECANSNEIPFIHLPLDNDNKWTSGQYKQYGLDLASTTPSNSNTKNGDLISCRSPDATGLVIPEVDFTKAFPQNCALGLYNIDTPKKYRLDTSSNDLSIFCLECQPGYQKKLNSDNQISSCEKIEHCNTTSLDQLFNACSQCEYGYVWSYDTQSLKINFDICIQNRIKNCLVSDGQKCIYCKKGFYLENEYKCNQINVDKCSIFNYTKQDYYFINTTDSKPIQIQYSFGLYLSLNQDGCQQCEQNYTLITTPDLQLKQCVSSYNVQNDDLLDSNYLINNCEIYTGYYKGCQRCKVGFLPNSNKSKCLSNINFAHCIQMNEVNQNNVCIKCEDDFYLVEGQCIKGNIEHCIVYEQDKIPAECIECASDMRPSRDNLSCIKGYLENCDLYNNTYENSCKECKTNETPLIQLDSGAQRCLQKLENHFCQDLDLTKIQDNIFKCNKCNTGYYQSNSSELINPSSFCLPYYQIENCEVYDTVSDYSLNSAKCNKCIDGFYVSEYGYNCLQRDININNCISYQNQSQKCQNCAQNFYLSIDKTQCIEYPRGIRFCIKYISLTECAICLEDYYLKDGQCLIVPDESKIENCIDYTTELTCSRCNTNYIQNSEGKCVIPEAQNCDTYESSTQCATCKPGMVFEQDQDTGLRSCRSYDIFKCEQINPEDRKCEKCGEGYFIKIDGTCELADPINFCMIYLSKTQCQQCQQGFYLSESKEECLRSDDIVSIPNNCQYAFYEQVPQCVYCKYGYYITEEGCNQCKDTGCAACNQNDPAICYLCKTGYYQSEDLGKCLENPVPQVEVLENILIDKVLKMIALFILILYQFNFQNILFQQFNYVKQIILVVIFR